MPNIQLHANPSMSAQVRLLPQCKSVSYCSRDCQVQASSAKGFLHSATLCMPSDGAAAARAAGHGG